jgi:prophage regulatory protein
MTSSPSNIPDDIPASAAHCAKCPPIASDRLITCQDVLDLLSESRSSFYALVRAGEFPPPIKRGRASRWRQSEVDAYIAKIAVTGRNRAAA